MFDQQEHRSSRCGDGPPLPASAPVLVQVSGGESGPSIWQHHPGPHEVTPDSSLNPGQHFPLYRRSDANCSGEDAAPADERDIPFKERYDVLSREASQKVCSCPGC